MKRSFLFFIMLLSVLPACFAVEQTDTLKFVYKLHGQTRRFQYVFVPERDGGVTLHWGIERNLKWWSGTYRMTPQAVEAGNSLSFMMPEDGNHIKLSNDETFSMISRKAYDSLKDTGEFIYDGVEYKLLDRNSNCNLGNLLHAIDAEGGEVWILDCNQYPIIWEMRNNPLEINWKVR